MSFVHLHCHSEYSLLDGANRIDDLIRRAQEFEQPGLAITDHGNLHAAWEFQEKAKKAGIKPIIGMEAYVAPADRRTKAKATNGAKPYFLSLIHISEPTRQAEISYAVFCLKKKKHNTTYEDENKEVKKGVKMRKLIKDIKGFE